MQIPDIYFKKRNILTSELIQATMDDMIKEDLFLTYQNIMKSHSIKLPIQASTGELAIGMVKELCYRQGKDPKVFIKQFFKMQQVKDVLNTNHRKNRNRILKSWMENVLDDDKSKIDLSELLIKKLNEAD